MYLPIGFIETGMMTQRKVVELSGFIIVGGNIHYFDDTVLIADSVTKMKVLLENVFEESKKKGLFINRKKIDCIVTRSTIHSKANRAKDVVWYNVQDVERSENVLRNNKERIGLLCNV